VASEQKTTDERVHGDRVVDRTEAVDLERLHVENVDTLELTEELEALETGSLDLAVDPVSRLLLFVDPLKCY
jgi:hypothetical protein